MDILEARSDDPTHSGPLSFDDALARAKRYAEQGQFDEAERIWTDLHHRFPNQRQLYVEACTLLREHAQIDKADAWLAAGQQQFPDDLGFAIERAWLSYHRQDMPEAIRRWRSVRAIFPDQAAGYAGLAISLRDNGQLDEAEAVLVEAKDRFPTDAGIAMEYAWLANRRRDWQAASARWATVRALFGRPGDRHGVRSGGRSPAGLARGTGTMGSFSRTLSRRSRRLFVRCSDTACGGRCRGIDRLACRSRQSLA